MAQRIRNITKGQFFYNLLCRLSSKKCYVLYHEFKDSTDRHIVFVIAVAFQPRIPYSTCTVRRKKSIAPERIINLKTHRQLNASTLQTPMPIDWLPEMIVCF